MIGFITFVLGFFSGGLFVIAVSLYLARKHAGKHKEELEKFTKELETFVSKTKSIVGAQERMAKVKEITMKQLDLRARADGPQKNSLDGKYKNGLTHEIKRLEEEKVDVLRSILKDNLDPEVTVLDESNQTKTMKLSEYMDLMGHSVSKEEPVSQPTKANKFTVYRGGKSDDDDGNDGKTFH